jgi:hypothetical protein
MLTVSKHARERWQKRVNSTAGEDAEEQARQACQNSDYIGDDPKDLDVSYYVSADHWLFCVNTKKEHIITVVEIDFGHDDDLNKIITNKLLDKIRKARNEYNKENKKVDENMLFIQSEKERLDNEIKILEQEYKKLEATEQTVSAELSIKKTKLDGLIKEIVYSIAFRQDQLVLKNEK